MAISNSQMIVSKRAIVVERAGGPLISLTPFFDRCDCEVLRTADTRAVTALIRDARRLSLVLVNGDTLRSDPVTLVTTIKDAHPDLPILWFATESGGVRGHQSQKIDYIGGDVSTLEPKIAKTLKEGFYSARLVQLLADAAAGAFSEFHLPVTVTQTCIKSSLTVLNELNAVIYFQGRRLSGHAVLSSTAGDLKQSYARLFSRQRGAGLDDLEDFLGEAANRLIGRVKHAVEGNLGDCSMSQPQFIRGPGGALRSRAGAQALVVDFCSEFERLQLELSLSRFEGRVPGISAVDDLAPGVVKFL